MAAMTAARLTANSSHSRQLACSASIRSGWLNHTTSSGVINMIPSNEPVAHVTQKVR
jgi:hypothetical protein